jgi:DNA-damage-inducible protein D
MKPAVIRTLTDTFEGHAQQTETGVEYWLARDLQQLLGYTEWRNFQAVLAKARTACEVSGRAVSDHFVDVNKTIGMPKGASKDVADVMLTRYACYLIAQNGDPRKDEIAFAPTIVLKAKDFATEITIHNAREHELQTEGAISSEHVINNDAVRETLLSRGIRPEELPAAEDVMRVERRLKSEEKASLAEPGALGE